MNTFGGESVNHLIIYIIFICIYKNIIYILHISYSLYYIYRYVYIVLYIILIFSPKYKSPRRSLKFQPKYKARGCFIFGEISVGFQSAACSGVPASLAPSD